MTTRKLFSEQKPRKPFAAWQGVFRPAFFLHELKRSWPRAICCFLTIFLAVPIPLLFSVSRRNYGEEIAGDYLNLMPFYALLAGALAVLCGLWAMSYLHGKVSADAFHSLPLRREGLLLNNALVGLCDFFAALLINSLLSQLILTLKVQNIDAFGDAAGVVFRICGTMMLTYLLFFMLMLLCGVLAGTSFGQLMLFGTFVGWYPLFRLGVMCFAGLNLDHIDINRMINLYDWGKTSPLVRLFYLQGDPFRPAEILVWIGLSLALFAVAALFYRLRRVERAGTPVAFRVLSIVVKYMLLTLATMGFGGLFYAIGNGLGWMIFGFIFGAFVSFLLLNVILTKNARQMFVGWPRLLLFLLIFLLVYMGFALLCSRVIDNYVPEPESVREVSIYLEGMGNDSLSFREEAVIRAAVALVEQAKNGEVLVSYDLNDTMRNNWPMTEETDENGKETTYLRNYIDLTVYMHMEFWIGDTPVAYQYYAFSRADVVELMRTIAETDTFRQALVQSIDPWYNKGYAEVNFDGTVDRNIAMDDDLNEKNIWFLTSEQVACLQNDLRQADFEMFQYPLLCNFYSNRGPIAITAGMTSFFDTFIGGTKLYENIAREWADRGGVTVCRDDVKIIVTDPDQLIQIAAAVCAYQESSISVITALDCNYEVYLPLDSGYMGSYFIDGKVPAFIAEALKK